MYAFILFLCALLMGVFAIYGAQVSLFAGIVGSVLTLAFLWAGVFCLVKDFD